MELLRWDSFCNFGALLGFGTLFTNTILLWIRNFEKNRTTPTPKKNQKTPKKDMDFHDGITCQRFELEGWDLVQCLLISFCFGSEILKEIGPPQPPKGKGNLPQKLASALVSAPTFLSVSASALAYPDLDPTPTLP